jgi:hypothetical protein
MPLLSADNIIGDFTIAISANGQINEADSSVSNGYVAVEAQLVDGKPLLRLYEGAVKALLRRC